MKKISDFIPNKVLEKKQKIEELNSIFKSTVDINIQTEINVINYNENTITIECTNSSVASIVKFDRDKYIKILKNCGMYNIDDIKIKLM